jgi:hypothetical protein
VLSLIAWMSDKLMGPWAGEGHGSIQPAKMGP